MRSDRMFKVIGLEELKVGSWGFGECFFSARFSDLGAFPRWVPGCRTSEVYE